MDFLTWITLGLVVGAIAKFIMPGKDPGGLIVTVLIGIAGAMIGGELGRGFGFNVTGFNGTSIMVATGGAILLLILYRLARKR